MVRDAGARAVATGARRSRSSSRKMATARTSSARLQLQALGRRGAFLDQRGVLLRDLVHLRHRLADLRDAGALLDAGGADLADDVGHALDRADDLGHRRARLVDQRRALLDALDAVGDQRLDFLGRRGAALREAAHLGGHHREAAALLAGARRFDRRVQREDVGLEGDAVDHADDVGDAARALVDALHRVDDLPTTSPPREATSVARARQLVGLRARCRRCCAPWRSARPSWPTVCFQRAGLLLGALAQVGVAGGDLRRARSRSSPTHRAPGRRCAPDSPASHRATTARCLSGACSAPAMSPRSPPAMRWAAPPSAAGSAPSARMRLRAISTPHRAAQANATTHAAISTARCCT